MSTQFSPDVFNAVSNVAMLDAQGHILSAKIWICIAAAALIMSFVGFCFAVIKDWTGAGGATVLIAFFFSLTILGFNLPTLWNPLANAAAHDGRTALAEKVMDKIE